MEINLVQKITRINNWLEIFHGDPDCLSWDTGHSKQEAFELYNKYQPERSKREDLERGCGALNSMET